MSGALGQRAQGRRTPGPTRSELTRPGHLTPLPRPAFRTDQSNPAPCPVHPITGLPACNPAPLRGRRRARSSLWGGFRPGPAELLRPPRTGVSEGRPRADLAGKRKNSGKRGCIGKPSLPRRLLFQPPGFEGAIPSRARVHLLGPSAHRATSSGASGRLWKGRSERDLRVSPLWLP